MLTMDADVPITYTQFLDSCRNFVSVEDMDVLMSIDKNARYTGSVDHPFLTRYNSFTDDLTEELQRIRSSRGKGRTDGDESRSGTMLHNQTVLATVKRAVEQENPLEAEKSIMNMLWNEIEYLKDGHSYDEVSIYAYALELRILERKAVFVPIEGNAEFKRLFTNLQSSIKSL